MIRRVLTIAMACLTAAAWPWTPAMAVNVEPYSIVVKDSASTPSQLGSGGLSFDSDQEVTPPNEQAGVEQELNPQGSPSPSITIPTASFLPTTLRPFTFDTVDPLTPLKVVVVTNNLCKSGDRGSNAPVVEHLWQGPNVEGMRYRLTGSKIVGAASITLALNFKLSKTASTCPDGKTSYSFTRTYDVERYWTTTAQCAPAAAPCWKVISGGNQYHIWNPQSLKTHPDGSIPEPGSLALLLAGAAAAGLALRGRRGKASARTLN
ncbi:MAG: PEP-CTERM sorting domain-containing protein [Gallionellaceae bacterium]|nr:PEP-CTERM sorting domain-containing protein [Gallionellaceae bacterium]